MNTTDAKRVLETALICAPQPLSVRELGTLFDMEVSADTLKTLLADWCRSPRAGVSRAGPSCGPTWTGCTPRSHRVTAALLWKRWPSLPTASP